ncbi:metal ABC transporter permease [Pelagibacterium sp. 26DY04]|uniref:metal ABC transporter permease n=1 Tax=Pelagibacterium sp. 26DY04 TaxID=2967130 RepID=UPI00281628AC|nr:metal ABC transporter permease [Pelagibacterium sp. 26DY04]WMT86121.1 metal ABC transporter permease [Pelagibacterium sp. 26DY04]
MFSLLADYTIQNVMIGAALLGIVSGVLGSFAVLRKQSLLGDTLSHAALPGICIGFLVAGTRSLPAILIGALLTGALAALIVLALTRSTRLKTDASLGIALSIFFALGIVLLTFIQNAGSAAQGGLESFLFGQAAAILRSDLYVMGAIALLALALVLLFWKEFKLVTFDPAYARTLGLPVLALEAALTTMIALAVVVGLQMVGVVLMAAMIIAPAVAARQWTDRLGVMVGLAALFGMASGLFGALVSATGRGLATGPLIVLAISAIVALSLLFAPGRGLIFAAIRQRENSRQLRSRRVLSTLYRLAAEHSDPAYPAEQRMLDAYHGAGTASALKRLEDRGLVTGTRHHPEPTPHWVLTPKGIAEAEAELAPGGNVQ